VGTPVVGERVAVRAGHASHHVVPAGRCHPVPPRLSDEDAAWFALAKIAFAGALRSGAGLGSRLLIVGAGPVGQMATRWVAAAGALDIAVADLSPDRLSLAHDGGATATVAGPFGEDQDRVREAMRGRLPETVIDCTGNPAVLAAALRLAADGGRVVLLGDTGTPARQHLTGDVLSRGLTVIGAHESITHGDPRWDEDREIYRLFFRLAATPRFRLAGLVGHRYRPEDCLEAYRGAAAVGPRTIGIAFDWAD
jgi:threonine dehydrogenase-like Zn-dependent dehydrogenase